MNEKRYFNLYIHGEDAVKAAEKFCKNSCFRGIREHNKFLAQMEIIDNNLIVVSYIENDNKLNKVYKQLNRLGFAGMKADLTNVKLIGALETETEAKRNITI